MTVSSALPVWLSVATFAGLRSLAAKLQKSQIFFVQRSQRRTSQNRLSTATVDIFVDNQTFGAGKRYPLAFQDNCSI